MKTINKVILTPADRNCSGSRCVNKVEVLSRNTSGRQLNRAFTLVELLVVVLIIGILSAIAIPMYQGAVDKSHWSTMLPASKAIKDAEEAFKMTNGEYSDTMEHLDVQISNNDLTFTLNTPNNLSQPNVVRVTNSKLDNVRLASYLDASPKFARQLHCEAKNEGSTPNARGQRLCEKLLGGQELTNQDGYTGYLLDQSIDKAICDDAGRAWANTNNTCYSSEQTRCEGLYNDETWNGSFCGYLNLEGVTGKTIGEGMTCQASVDNACRTTTLKDGGECITTASGGCMGGEIYENSKCIAQGGVHSECNSHTIYAGGLCTVTGGSEASCAGSTVYGVCDSGNGRNRGCADSIIKDGGVCIGTGGFASCGAITVESGGTCIAYNANSCTVGWNSEESTYLDGSACVGEGKNTCSGINNMAGTCRANNEGACANNNYIGNGCCEGPYCPSDAPHC